MIHLRPFSADDLEFADEVRARAGWNQTRNDWLRLLALAPEGCFLAEWDGRPAGTALALIHGPELAWIGMVLVHPDFRRRGIGRALLEHGLEHLRRRGVRCIGLDATPLGRPVYAALGFRDDRTLTRWEHASWKSPAGDPDPGLRPWPEGVPSDLLELDAGAFGIARTRLLSALLPGIRAARVAGPEGGTTGYGMLRDGARAWYLGPVVAREPATGLALVDALLRQVEGARVFWDVPDDNAVAADWARAHGFVAQRSLTRMFLGDSGVRPRWEWQFGLAGPETG